MKMEDYKLKETNEKIRKIEGILGKLYSVRDDIFNYASNYAGEDVRSLEKTELFPDEVEELEELLEILKSRSVND